MEKSQKLIIAGLSVALCVVIAVLVVLIKDNNRQSGFVIPPLDDTAVSGTPDNFDAKEHLYSECRLNSEIAFCICGNATVNGNEVEVYFTSDRNNTALLRLMALDGDGKEIGTTGIVEPGKYVKTLKLDTAPTGDSLGLKIVTYEPETYYSLGSATATVNLVTGY